MSIYINQQPKSFLSYLSYLFLFNHLDLTYLYSSSSQPTMLAGAAFPAAFLTRMFSPFRRERS